MIRPNILLIMVDNQPADLLGCSGNQEINTKNLDRLAHQGIRFTNSFCTNAMCSPCRASVLTGLMPSQHGVHTWIDDRSMDKWPKAWNAIHEFRTLPEILTKNGYKTALIGKYHVGDPFSPQNGFQHWVAFPHGHTRSFWDNTFIENNKQHKYAGHSVDYFTEKAVEYINGYSQDSNNPFFLFLTYNGPYGHWPALTESVRNRFYTLYENTEMKSVPRQGLSDKAIARFLLELNDSWGGFDMASHLRNPNDLNMLRSYFSEITMVDDGVGRVLDTVHIRGLDESTLVIYTADHGFSLGHNGYWGHGQATWPSNAHRLSYNIPMLIRHSNYIQPLQVTTSLFSQVDLFATILDYVGLGDAQGNQNSPSCSFASVLRGEQYTPRDAIFVEQEETRAVRTDKWLYMRRFNESRKYPLEDEMYNLSDDPNEQNDVLRNSESAETAKELAQRTDNYFRKYSDPKYDLWHGGKVKSNSDRPYLWKDAWGESWRPLY